MLNILKAELNKFLKSKIFIALIILLFAFPLLTASMYQVVKNTLLGGIIGSNEGDLARETFLASFSPMNNFGLLLLILLLIVIVGDFTNNTIRNKVIAGYKRSKIYGASALFTLIAVVVFATAYALLSYGAIGLVMGFKKIDVGKMVLHYLLLISSLLVVYSFIHLLAFLFKSIGATIGLGIGTFFALMIVVSILGLKGQGELLIKIFPFLGLSSTAVYSYGETLLLIVINLGYLALFTGLGFYANNKLDYK